MRLLTAAFVVALSIQPALHAEEPALPDPTAVVVPDLSGSSKPEVVREGAKYFFFRQQGVSFEQAHADLSDCFRFLQPSSWENVHLNRFVPWVSKPGRQTIPSKNPYGLVGAVIASAVEGTLNHRDYQAKLRSCMEPRGYTRYGVAEDVWKRVRKLPPDQSIAVQAKIASGPGFGTKVIDK
ncbi:MAG TPA: hypothetical protein VJZ00_07840 [Thermoanaerobaculia bacterium]|nr:hypothetical protein [Thermoanaerobaculia bacterium]